jgi:hypothetical protein
MNRDDLRFWMKESSFPDPIGAQSICNFFLGAITHIVPEAVDDPVLGIRRLDIPIYLGFGRFRGLGT